MQAPTSPCDEQATGAALRAGGERTVERLSGTQATVALPMPRAIPILDYERTERRDMLTLLTRAAACGDIVTLRTQRRCCALIVHPLAIERVLITQQRNYQHGSDYAYLQPVIGDGLLTREGVAHLQQRRMLQPAFHRAHIATYATAMVTNTRQMLDRWRSGTTVDMQREMEQVTLRIAVRLLFGAEVAAGATPRGSELAATLADLHSASTTLQPASRRAAHRLDAVLYALIAERRGSGQEGDDVLSLLLSSRDVTGAALPARQIRDELMTLLFAGHETTASALTWCFFHLAMHPSIDALLHDELTSTLQGRVPVVEDLSRLPYTTMVIAETLRLCPPIWAMTRRAVADDEIMGYHVPAGMDLLISPYVTQRDPRFFADPEHFSPERFHPASDVRRGLPRFAYFPFSGGVRQCIGDNFARMEATLLLASIAQRFRVHLAPHHVVTPQAAITLRPRGGLPMIVEERQVAASPGARRRNPLAGR